MNQMLPWVLLAAAVTEPSDLPLDLEYVTVAPPEIGPLSLTITLTPNQTVIRDGERELIIDYADLEVRRIDPDLPAPHISPLHDPNAPPDDPPAAPPEEAPGEAANPDTRQPTAGVPISEQLAALSEPPAPSIAEGDPEPRRDAAIAAAIARYEITTISAGAPVRGYPVSARVVWFGRGFLAARLAGELHYPLWGRRFSERRITFWVTRDHADYRTIEALARERAPILRANPMLAHVDWTLLIPELGGVPIALEERGRDMRMRLELEARP